MGNGVCCDKVQIDVSKEVGKIEGAKKESQIHGNQDFSVYENEKKITDVYFSNLTQNVNNSQISDSFQFT